MSIDTLDFDAFTTTKVFIDPDFAGQMLELNTGNRPIRSGTVERYARDMKDGNWTFTGEAIKISTDKELLDGQHRLWACFDSGIPFEALVITGLKKESQKNMDSGATRRSNDQLALSGHKNSTQLTSVIKIYDNYLHQRPLNHLQTTSEVFAFLEQNPDFEGLVAEFAKAAKKIPGVSHKSQFIAAAILVSKYSLQPKDVQEEFFINQVAEGLGLSSGSPALALRNKMMSKTSNNSRLDRHSRMSDIVSVWNKHVKGEKVLRVGGPVGGWTVKNRPMAI